MIKKGFDESFSIFKILEILFEKKKDIILTA